MKLLPSNSPRGSGFSTTIKPRILVNDRPIPKLLVKAQALLFYLALTPHRQSRETLSGLLWGDLPEENARTNLRTALSRLRRHLGDRLVATRQHNMPEEMALALMGLGLLAVIGGNTGEAEEHLEASLALCQAHQLPWVQANVLNMLAWIQERRKQADQAKDLGQQALALFQEMDDVTGMAAALTTLGIIYSNLKEYAAAEKAYGEALERCRQSGHRVGESQALTGLFVVAYRQGDTAKALAYGEASLAVSYDVGNRLGMAIAYHNLGYAARAASHTQAIAHFLQALQIYETMDADALRTSNTRRYLAESLIAEGRFAEAQAQLAKALGSLPESAYTQRGVELLLAGAQLFLEIGQVERAAHILVFLKEKADGFPHAQQQVEELSARLPALFSSPYPSLAALVSAVHKQLAA